MHTSDSMGLYIHIPFCSSKCAYCDFFSMRGNEERFYQYTEVLKNRIEYFSGVYKDRKIDTIYFGGGTPSLIGAGSIASVIDKVKNCFPLSDTAEITVEVNPECCDASFNFSQLKEAGVSRISIGMQTSAEEELKLLGRKHTNRQVTETVKLAKDSGINNISLDLMLGIPLQTESSLKESIDFCSSLNVQHISSYILKIEENTLFKKRQSQYSFPDEDAQAQLYLCACELLEKAGFKQYEISNFSKPGFESRHNLKYWNFENYLGIGPAAHSFMDGKRFFYSRSLEKFKNNIIEQDDDCSDSETFIMLKLRLTKGLDLSELKSRFDISPSPAFFRKAKLFQKAGLCRLTHQKETVFLSLTPKGFLLSNSIILELLESLN